MERCGSEIRFSEGCLLSAEALPFAETQSREYLKETWKSRNEREPPNPTSSTETR